MERNILFIALVLFSASTNAQVLDPTPQPSTVYDECLLATAKEEWSALGLTSAQVERVLAIQTSCKTDCVMIKETGKVDASASQGALEKHRERVESVLSEEQYRKWLAWCSERPAHTQLGK